MLWWTFLLRSPYMQSRVSSWSLGVHSSKSASYCQFSKCCKSNISPVATESSSCSTFSVVLSIAYPTGSGTMTPTRRMGEEGLFCHQWDSDQSTYHHYSQVHLWSLFQEWCPLGTQRDLQICHDGDGNSRCVHWHRAQQRCRAKGISNVLYNNCVVVHKV